MTNNFKEEELNRKTNERTAIQGRKLFKDESKKGRNSSSSSSSDKNKENYANAKFRSP
jgi:hypothetical protein